MSRVAVLGASGFVGATLIERWLASGRVEPKAIIHSTGNAWRLARHGIELHVVDTLDRESLTETFAGCTHVVNCARGGHEVMLRGLENALAAAAAAGVRRFVHLSSIAIFAELPPNEIASERSPARPAKGSYGWLKLQQDALVARAHDRGLSNVVLCPTHIFGAYSQFLLVCIAALRARRFALVDEGTLPASFVDVSNLCAAIELSLECERSDGRAIVIEDDQKLTWRDVAEALAPLADATPPFPSVERERALVRARETLAPPSLRSALRVLASHVTSSAFKNMLKSDPMLSSLGESGLRMLRRVPGTVGKRLLRAASGATAETEAAPSFDDWSLRAQALSVRFATDRAREILGYKPERSFGESMAALASWYRATHGHGSADEALLRHL